MTDRGKEGTDKDELIRSAARGDADSLRRLLEGGADPNARTADDETPLSFAVVWNQLEIVEVLLRAGADCEQLGSAWSPLMHAALEGNAELVDELLAAGADPARADAHDRTSADIAEAAGHHALARHLRAKE